MAMKQWSPPSAPRTTLASRGISWLGVWVPATWIVAQDLDFESDPALMRFVELIHVCSQPLGFLYFYFFCLSINQRDVKWSVGLLTQVGTRQFRTLCVHVYFQKVCNVLSLLFAPLEPGTSCWSASLMLQSQASFFLLPGDSFVWTTTTQKSCTVSVIHSHMPPALVCNLYYEIMDSF